MARKWQTRHADVHTVLTPYCLYAVAGAGLSTLGLYSSDIGSLMGRNTSDGPQCAAMVVPSSVPSTIAGAIKYIGILEAFDPDSTAAANTPYCKLNSTNKIWIRRFDKHTEYDVAYSTLNSTVHPATSDIGSIVGLPSTTLPNISTNLSSNPDGAVLSMSNINSSGDIESTEAPKFFRITGFSTNRRRLFGYPVEFMSSIASLNVLDW